MISVSFFTALFPGNTFLTGKGIAITKYGPELFKDDATILDILSYFGCEEMADDMYLWDGHRWGTTLMVNGDVVPNRNRGSRVVKSFNTDGHERYFISLIERADPS